jgi:ribonuclease Z
MKVYAEVLTAPSADTPGTTILLHFDSKKYVFGQFSEGTQRAFMERHVRLNKVSNVFLTGPVQWSNTAGLAGTILALGEGDGLPRDPGIPENKQQAAFSVHGGENLLYSLSTMRRFAFRTGMSLAVNELVPNTPEFRDENLVVRTLHIPRAGEPLRPQDGEEKKAFLGKAVNDMFCSSWNMNTFVDDEAADGDGTEPEYNPQLSTKLPPKGKTRAPWPASTIKTLPSTKPNTVALSYIIQLHEQRGKFLPSLAKKLGVKPGPDFSKLASGQSITTAEGRVVNPEDVMEPSREGTGIAICDIPSLAYLPNFLAASDWENVETVQRTIGCFFWLIAGEVISDPRFQEFVARFPNSRHAISSPDVLPDRIHFKGAAKSAVLLNSLDPELFPEPKLNCAVRQSIDTSRFVIAIPGLQWQIEPKWHLRTETVEPLFDREEIVNSDVYKTLAAVVEGCRQNVALEIPDLPGKDAEIFTLGTGSSSPSRHRNVSSTLVRIPGIGSVLLDCGEGTLGQLKRLFSHEKGALEAVLRDIKLVYVSHLHADHHLGSTSILSMKHALQPQESIFVVGPEVFYTWLKEYAAAEPGMDAVLANIVFIPSESLQSGLSRPEA